jgi:hypothetical protein
MKNILSILVAVVGVACIVFGVIFIMSASSGKTTVVDEMAASGVTVDNLNAKYDLAKKGLADAMTAMATASDAAKATVNEKIQDAGWQKASLGLAKSNLAMVDFVQKSGILTIVIGAGLVLAGWGLMKKS